MKRILSILSISLLSLLSFQVSFAEDTAPAGDGGSDGGIKVIVTEKVPGAQCDDVPSSVSGPNVSPTATKKYSCTVQGWFATVMDFFGGLIRWATFVTALLGVLMIVYSGFEIVASAGSDKARSAAKTRIMNLIGGLALLFLVAFVLNTIAPWIYR